MGWGDLCFCEEWGLMVRYVEGSVGICRGEVPLIV
jgi:hypothetical protein